MEPHIRRSRGCIYRIDADDVISLVGGDWSNFANENDAPELCPESVIGTSIWRHVEGETVRRLYAELFRALRSERREIAVPFNCDSPSLVRIMTLTLRSLGGGVIELEGTLNESRVRPPIPLFERRMARATSRVAICSVCRRVDVRGEWVAIDEALVRRPMLATSPSPILDEELCPTCQSLCH